MKRKILYLVMAFMLPLFLMGCKNESGGDEKHSETKYLIVSIHNTYPNPHSPIQMDPKMEIEPIEDSFATTEEAIKYAQPKCSRKNEYWENKYDEEIVKYHKDHDEISRVMAATYFDKMHTLYYVVKITAPEKLFTDKAEMDKYISDNWNKAEMWNLSDYFSGNDVKENDNRISFDIFPLQ